MASKYKKVRLIPLLQTALDVIIANGLLVALHFLLPEDLSLRESVEPWLLFNLALLPIAVVCYYRHRHRMARSERLVLYALNLSIVQVLLFASLLYLFGMQQLPLQFIGALAISMVLALSLAWLLEEKLLHDLRRHGFNLRLTAIVGTGAPALELAAKLQKNAGHGVSIIGFFDDHKPENFKGNYLGTLDDLEKACADHNLDWIFYASRFEDYRAINRVIYICDQHFCDLFLTPLMSPKLQAEFYMRSMGGSIPVIGVHPSPLHSAINMALKRSFDILFSGTVLLFSPIVLIPVAIAIKISSPGPIFFKQKRTGYMGNDFYCYKFRTMKVNKDSDTQQATRNDDRKTKVGNFLRHTSIDELPQFWNVFIGDMSIVGPRPHMLAHTEEYRSIIQQYMTRHLVKPGITGWAQVSGYRGATDELWQMEKRVEYDVWYIEHWSFLLDLKIIVKTVTNAISGEENAY